MKHRDPGVLMQHTGTLFRAWNPGPGDVKLNHDCEALARIPRFGGRTPQPWSVAQHLLLCQTLAGRYLAAQVRGDAPWYVELHDAPHAMFMVLTHDFAEAYGLGDIPTPMKSLLTIQNPQPRLFVADDGKVYEGPMRITIAQWEEHVLSMVREAFAGGREPMAWQHRGFVNMIDGAALAVEADYHMGGVGAGWPPVPDWARGAIEPMSTNWHPNVHALELCQAVTRAIEALR